MYMHFSAKLYQSGFFFHLLGPYSLFCTILVLKRKVSWLHKFTFQATADITGRRFLISCQYPQITRITLPLVAPPTFVSCFIRQSNCQSHWTQVDRAPLSSFIANNLTRHPAAATEILISRYSLHFPLVSTLSTIVQSLKVETM